jgi:hypothetical protein
MTQKMRLAIARLVRLYSTYNTALPRCKGLQEKNGMITVTAPLWIWSGEGGSWHFVTIPAEEAVEIRLEAAASGVRRGFGSVRVAASINGVAWKTSVFPQKSGGYLLPVKASVRRDAGIAADDVVTVSLELL